MSFYPMKARSINGNPVTFSICDCPKYYDEDVLYLAARPNSELIYLNTLTRGSDIFDIDGNRVYEGDIIQDLNSKVIYVVSFAAGFHFSSLRGERKSLEELHPFEIAGTVFEYFGVAEIKSFLKRDIHSHIRYRTRDGTTTFKLANIVMASEKGLIARTSKRASFIKYDDLLQDTNVKGIYGESLFYSEVKYGQYVVTMHRGLIYYDSGKSLIPAVGSKKSDLLGKV